MCPNKMTTEDVQKIFESVENKERLQMTIPFLVDKIENGKENFSDNEIQIIKRILDFNEKIDNAYKARYKKSDLDFRNYIGTDDNILIYFFIAYNNSKYYKKDTGVDENINSKIFEQLKNIIFEIFLIWEFDFLDENSLNKEQPENEYELLYNLNKTQNLIIKTRILWEKVMNFFYLLIERSELKAPNNKKSKKATFIKWCKEKNIDFFDEAMDKLKVFDEKFRNSEVHEYSKLKNFFEHGKIQNIYLYCFNLIIIFSNEVIINIMAYINDKDTNYRIWQRLPDDLTEQLKEFIEPPEWVKNYTKDLNINDLLEIGDLINNKTGLEKR